MTTLTVSGTIDEIIAFADLLKIGRGVMVDAIPDPSKLTLKEADLVRAGNYIMAIKEVRVRTNCDLRAARDLVDASPERRDFLANPVNNLKPYDLAVATASADLNTPF